MHSPAFRRPDEYTFTSVLKACSGLVAVFDGQKVHAVVAKMGHQSNLCVSNSLVDMYFRFGLPVTAKLLFDEMLVRDVVTWNTLVNGYSLCGDVVSARCVFDQMDDKNMISWSAMITGYARSGDLDSARWLFNEMPERNVVVWNAIIAGYTQNEKSHPQSDKIYSKIRELGPRMQIAGYKPNTDLVLQSVEEEEKENALSTHSEKLAIAFGLINTSEGTTIRIVKNLRVCSDCHEAAKIISKVVKREIIVRDRSRFHIFREGSCSCNDYCNCTDLAAIVSHVCMPSSGTVLSGNSIE
ncbi:hypothetical protein MKW92_000566 [Papaver armeniacum]|nr:hypothetical protein MKW92_000566 [Papaver armeniacum]